MRPFDFQLAGARHLQGGRVRLLADEMGLGKTLQAIIASEDDPERPVTVVCPAILAAEWQEAFANVGGVPRSVAVLGEKRGVDPARADVVISSYDRAARPEGAAVLASRRRGGAHLILDEAHALKQPDAVRTRAILGDALPEAGGISQSAGRISFLTGTPAPNNASELYSMLATSGRVDCGFWEFARRVGYVRETTYGPMPSGLRDAGLVKNLLSGFMLRRTNAVELPPTDYGEIIVEPRECGGVPILAELARHDREAAGTIARAAAADSFDGLDTPHVATLRRLVGMAKVAAVAEQAAAILEADPSAKIVLFAIHRTVIDMLADRLSRFSPVRLVGGETDVKRKRAKDAFQADPKIRVAVCQMRAAGAGLTLTAANHLWIVEPSWTPADNDQAVKRIVRIGQARRTSVAYVTLATSIDAAVNAVLRRKRNFIDQFI